MQKLYCYVDETGQDTKGVLFSVCCTIARSIIVSGHQHLSTIVYIDGLPHFHTLVQAMVIKEI